MRRIGAIMVTALIGLGAASCSSTVSNEEFKQELVKAGLPEKDAQCIIDGMQAKGVKVKRYSEMSSEDTAVITQAATDCAMKSAGLDPKQMSITTPTTPN